MSIQLFHYNGLILHLKFSNPPSLAKIPTFNEYVYSIIFFIDENGSMVYKNTHCNLFIYFYFQCYENPKSLNGSRLPEGSNTGPTSNWRSKVKAESAVTSESQRAKQGSGAGCGDSEQLLCVHGRRFRRASAYEWEVRKCRCALQQARLTSSSLIVFNCLRNWCEPKNDVGKLNIERRSRLAREKDIH